MIHEEAEQCRQLWAAVLERAVDDLTHRTERIRDSAIAWIWVSDNPKHKDYFNSCRSICLMVGIDYDALVKHSIKVYRSNITRSPRKRKIEDAMKILKGMDTTNMRISEIMRATGTPGQETIRVRLGRLGKTYKIRPAQVRTADIDTFFRDNDVSDLTSKQIADMSGLVRSTVQYRLRRDKIPHKRDSMRRPKAARVTKEWWA